MNLDYYRKKRILVTGGLGFIGSNLALRLAELDCSLTLVDSMIPGHGGNLFNIADIRDRVAVNFSDIRDYHSIQYIVQDKDVIFNLAGQVSHIDSMKDPFTDMEINCRSQLSLLEACRKMNPKVRIVFASTRQLYGKPVYLPVDEDHPINPTDINGIHKIAAEFYYSLYHSVYDMSTVSLRLTNTYGPRQYLRGNTQGFVGIFIRQALQSENIRVFGTGNQLRDFNYIDDVVEALLISGAKDSIGGKSYNLGHHDRHSLLEFVQLLKRLTGCSYEVVPFPEDLKKIDIGDYYSKYDAAESTLGWRPKTGLAEGMTRTIDFFKKNAVHYL